MCITSCKDQQIKNHILPKQGAVYKDNRTTPRLQFIVNNFT